MRRFSAILAIVAALAAAPRHASAQTLAVGPAFRRDSGSDFPGGPGVGISMEWPVAPFLGLRANLDQTSGSETWSDTFCSGLLPPDAQCVVEPVDHRSTVTSAELLAVLRTPEAKRVHFGVGGGVGAYFFRASKHGEVTGKESRPVNQDEVLPHGTTALVFVGFRPVRALPVGMELSAQWATASVDRCVMDAWGLCGTEHVARVRLAATWSLR